ncbi:MAG TPA: O-antigen ligase family protein [Pyrinomonadaceae bacterium]|nr:O-antigen ligase family protein [Pyrinomonadaceae bacterium]
MVKFSLLNKLVFGSLLTLIVITPIPYGTVEPWWKAAFVCAVFAICILALIDNLTHIPGKSVLLPMLALAALAFIQTLSLGSRTEANLTVWNTISADPYQTRFFTLQMLALTVFLALLYRYASTERRVRLLVYTILAIAVASAIFGILRQSTQQQTGFILPLLKPAQGYGQFINKNHFAYLMEMAFGLGLGIILGGGVKRDRLMIYVAILLPIWTALVLANSRGGVLAMITQIVTAVLLLTSVRALSEGYQFQKITQPIAVRALLVVVLFVGIVLGTIWVGGDRLATNFEGTGSEFTTDTLRQGASRNEIWRASLKMFAAHPILGVGLGGYWIGITAYHDASGLMTPQEAHNDYLELRSRGGGSGLALGIGGVVAVIRKARENLRVDVGYMRAVRLGAILGIAGVAAHSLVDFGLHIIVNAVVFLTLIMIATTRLDDSQRRKEG